jgi:hypothetical protein
MKMWFIMLFTILCFSSCHKDKPSCYSWSLERKMKNKICSTSCSGVVGCDGKNYCTECDANKKGIKIK